MTRSYLLVILLDFIILRGVHYGGVFLKCLFRVVSPPQTKPRPAVDRGLFDLIFSPPYNYDRLISP